MHYGTCTLKYMVVHITPMNVKTYIFYDTCMGLGAGKPAFGGCDHIRAD